MTDRRKYPKLRDIEPEGKMDAFDFLMAGCLIHLLVLVAGVVVLLFMWIF